MSAWFAAIFLVLGAALCLLAAVGVLRLPDFFMRMHAATKAGVVGCGLVLLGIGFADPTPTTWIKVLLAIAFLLLTTPVAGHLLGRAAYVSGVPMWQGTVDDQLKSVLPQGAFDRAAATHTSSAGGIRQIVLTLARGPHMDAAIERAIALARRHDAELVGLALIDLPRLQNVGSVPLGANWHAAKMREHRIARAREAAAAVIESFENQARRAGLRVSVRLEEGRPQTILQTVAGAGTVIAVAQDGWFDQGVLDLRVDVGRLVRSAVRPVLELGVAPAEIRRLLFVHDGSARSDATLRWLAERNPWPEATIRLRADGMPEADLLARARGLAADRFTLARPDAIHKIDAVVLGNGGGWLPLRARRPATHEAPVVVVG